MDKIFETVIKTGERKTRFILRLKPVSDTCKSFESDIKKALDSILEKFLSKEGNEELKYKVESKIRFNDNITSSHFIWYVRDSVSNIAPKWTACILEPRVVISFYVLRNVCCISILDKYKEYKKYNLSEVINPTTNNSECNLLSNEISKSVVSQETQEIVLQKNETQQVLSES